jgi:hypothetical protein
MQEGRIDDIDLSERLANGVKGDLFVYGLIPGGPTLLLLIVIHLIDIGWQDLLRNLPAYVAVSLGVAIIAGALMMSVSIRNQLERIAKAQGCKRDLTVWFYGGLTD